MSFHISALPLSRFEELFTLDDAAPGEPVILLPYRHQPADSPHQASGRIFVREQAVEASVEPGAVPSLLRSRILSVRAFDAGDLMVDADVVDGSGLEGLIERLFEDSSVRYLHVHFARPGCHACRVDRSDTAR